MHPFHSSPRDRIGAEECHRRQAENAEKDGFRLLIHRRCRYRNKQRAQQARTSKRRAQSLLCRIRLHGVPCFARHVLHGISPLEPEDESQRSFLRVNFDALRAQCWLARIARPKKHESQSRCIAKGRRSGPKAAETNSDEHPTANERRRNIVESQKLEISPGKPW